MPVIVVCSPVVEYYLKIKILAVKVCVCVQVLALMHIGDLPRPLPHYIHLDP